MILKTRLNEVSDRPMLIEGYAAIFDTPDMVGDVVRAGAFSRTLRRSSRPPMLLQHKCGAIAGEWVRIVEDGYGLFVRGLIKGVSTRALTKDGLDGLSIGFRPVRWHARAPGGRELTDVELVEVSLVAEPMQPAARFAPVCRLAA
ncbi:MAG: HK97 family phage prohead protease [Pseudomonadota bacterium]